MIEIKSISKKYMKASGEKRVFDGFSASLSLDSFTVLEGASGSGKTTLLRMLARLDNPDSGQITGMPERISVVFQEPRLFAHLTALENVALVCPRERAKEILCSLELGDALDKYPSELSGGMAQRVAIARAICYGGEYAILDEPFKGLDEELKKSVMSIVRSAFPGGLLITHQSDEAEYFGGKVLKI